VFSKYPTFVKDHHLCDLLCDSLRMAVSGTEPFDLDQLIELDMDVHASLERGAIASLSTMADSLPGLALSPPF